MKKIYLNTLKTEEIIKRLKAGEVVKTDDDQLFELKCVDGVICSFDGSDRRISTSILIDDNDDFYFEGADDPFKITETGVYKIRDGRRAYVSTVGSDVVDGVIEGNDYISQWDNNGTYFDYGASNCDLVEYVGD